MSELALYRKYRSAGFDEVVGQGHVVSTIQNALLHNRISHAYLFAGPRGVGKTTMARLLARSVNCTGNTKPCNQCTSCQAGINSHLDLIEIDAASNRSIDEIRELRAKIGIAPTLGKYKVYIIDEVHMLTKEAFNALLKTLEEPPAHAIFVLATTEAHKLPETIISRTQRFNFKPITNQDLENQLAKIAKTEKIQIDNDAIAMIASAAGGGFRDAIGMLDQLASSSEGSITANTVRQILGLADQSAIEALAINLAAGKTVEALAVVDQLTSQGTQISQVIHQLLQFWRGAMLIAAGAPVQVTQAQKTLASQVPISKIVAIIEQLSTANRSAHPQLLLEALIVALPLQAGDFAQPASIQQDLKPDAAAPAAPKANNGTEPKAIDGDQWTKALIIIKQHNNTLYSLLRSCQVALADSEIVISCQFSFHRDRLAEHKNRQIVDLAVRQAFGRALPVKIQVQPKSAPIPEPVSPVAELVGSALEILGGEVVDE